MTKMVSEMTAHEWFLGQALANPNIATGKAEEFQLRKWFGDRCGITKEEILIAQADEAATHALRKRKIK